MKRYKPVNSLAWDDNNQEKYKYDWNEADCLLPDLISTNISKFLSGNMSNWYPNINESKINELIANYNKCDSDQIMLTPGSDYAHEIILKYISKNTMGRCLIIGPTYDNFRASSESILNKTDILNFWMRENLLDGIVDENLDDFDLVYICSPNNPTGDLIPINILKKILNKYPKANILIDEAYIDFDLSSSVIELIKSHHNLIISRTFSKAWGLASFRVGYIVSNSTLISELGAFGNIKHVNQFAKIALDVVLNNNHYMLNYVSLVNKNKSLLEALLKEKVPNLLEVTSKKGNFVLLRFKSNSAQKEFYQKCVQNSFYVRSLSHLSGFENFIRLTVPTGLGFERMKNIFNKESI